MNYNVLYEYALDASLLSMFERSSEALSESNTAVRDSFNPLFRITGEEYYTHNAIVDVNEGRTIKTMALLLHKMLTKRGIENSLINEKYDEGVIAFSIKEKKKDIGVFLFFETTRNLKYKISQDQDAINELFDEIYFVCMVNPIDEDTRKIVCRPVLNENICNGNCPVITLKDFFIKYFSEEEYNNFNEHVDAFNEKAQSSIGFYSTLLPTEAAIKKFKHSEAEELKEYDYFSLYNKSFDNKQYEHIHDNYIGGERYKALIGDLNFSKSFISSEWNYKIHKITDSLDQTGIVAGYLKSVEQLLFELICFSKGEKNRKIALVKGRKHFVGDFNTPNEKYVNSTLQKLEDFMNYNLDLLSVEPKTEKRIIEALDDWREKYRNGYFHKHNLNNSNVVDEIREHAIYLYFLLLGSWQLKDENKYYLGILSRDTEIKVNEDELYEKMSSFINSRIDWIPDEVIALEFWLHPQKKDDNKCSCSLACMTEFSTEDDSWRETKMETENGDFGIYTFEWESLDNGEQSFELLCKLLKRYIEEFEKTKLNSFKAFYLTYKDLYTRKVSEEYFIISE